MLTESEIVRSFRRLLTNCERDMLAKAEKLLEELRPDSLMRQRLTEELNELRELLTCSQSCAEYDEAEDLEVKANKHYKSAWEDSEVDINQKMTVEIHICDADPKRDAQKLERLQSAVGDFLSEFGFSPDPENQPKEVHASWHWYEWFRSKLPFVRRESEQTYEEMKEALRRRYIDQTGADAFNHRATAAAELLKSIEPFADVVIRLGDVVIAKSTVDGVAKLGIETLSPELARRLDAKPYAMRNSAAYYQFMEEEKDQLFLPGTCIPANLSSPAKASGPPG